MAALAQTDVGTRDKILDAAEVLFARRGFSGVGMREVAEAAGLGKSSLFHHFKNKVELYAAVVGRILDLIESRLLRALAQGGAPLARFDRWLDTLIDILAEQPAAARLLLRSLFEDDDLTGESAEERAVEKIIERTFAAASTLLREGMENGVFRMASIPHTLQSLVGLTVYHFASGEFGEELVGQSLFAPAQVRKRKEEVKALLHYGLVARGSAE
jgi:TetR/AcrR family transcriptional regulator, acrAB operon repressor